MRLLFIFSFMAITVAGCVVERDKTSVSNSGSEKTVSLGNAPASTVSVGTGATYFPWDSYRPTMNMQGNYPLSNYGPQSTSGLVNNTLFNSSVSNSSVPLYTGGYGQCWASGRLNPKKVKQSVNLILKDPVNRINIEPALMNNNVEQIITKEGVASYQVIPPQYRSVTEQIEVRPSMKRIEVVPAQYQAQEYEVVVSAATQVVEPCSSSSAKYAEKYGAVSMCVRDIPAVTKKVTSQVLVVPEQMREVVDPPIYETITRYIMEVPAQTVPVSLPPESVNVLRQNLAKPMIVSQEMLPPETTELDVVAYEGQAQIATRQILCDQDINKNLIKQLQDKLNSQGYSVGKANGELKDSTMEALSKYQADNGLVEGLLSVESFMSLNISLK